MVFRMLVHQTCSHSADRLRPSVVYHMAEISGCMGMGGTSKALTQTQSLQHRRQLIAFGGRRGRAGRASGWNGTLNNTDACLLLTNYQAPLLLIQLATCGFQGNRLNGDPLSHSQDCIRESMPPSKFRQWLSVCLQCTFACFTH
jgi:hypothetical protein